MSSIEHIKRVGAGGPTNLVLVENVSYINTSERAKLVTICGVKASYISAANLSAAAKITVGSVVVGLIYPHAGQAIRSTVSFIVPPKKSYKITEGPLDIHLVTEHEL